MRTSTLSLVVSCVLTTTVFGDIYMHNPRYVPCSEWSKIFSLFCSLCMTIDNRKKSLLAWPSDWNSRFLFKIFTMRMLILFSVLLLYHNSLSSCIIPHKKAFAPTTYMSCLSVTLEVQSIHVVMQDRWYEINMYLF